MAARPNVKGNILVCLKQVPNTKNVRIDPEKHTLIREGQDSILNPFDAFALEEALRLKDKYGAKVGAVTMGPPQAIEILKYSLEKGADEAFLLSDIRLAGSDTLATSLALVALIRKTKYETIFCGQESSDSGTGHIGPSIAELVGFPHVNYAKRIMGINSAGIKVLAKFDDCDGVVIVRPPAVISFLKKPKRASLKQSSHKNLNDIIRYNLSDIGVSPESVGLDGSATRVIAIDVDERFVEYVTVDSSLPANERIRVILNGGISVRKDRKFVKHLSASVLNELANLMR